MELTLVSINKEITKYYTSSLLNPGIHLGRSAIRSFIALACVKPSIKHEESDNEWSTLIYYLLLGADIIVGLFV